jgi:hypothetical protein
VRITPVDAQDRRIPGLNDYWRTSERPEYTAETREEYDGGDPNPVVIAGRPTLGDLPVTRAYDPRRDQELLRRIHRRVGRAHFTVSVQDTDADDYPVGQPFVYQAVLRAVNPPNTDRNGTDTAMIGLTFHAYAVA